MEGVVKRFVQGAEKRNLTLDQYLDLLLNLHDLYDKTVNMHKGIIDKKHPHTRGEDPSIQRGCVSSTLHFCEC